MKTLWQIFAVARTEFRFGLRRGGPVVTTLLIGLVLGAGILIGPLANLSTSKEDLSNVLQNPTVIKKWTEKGYTVEIFRQTVVGSMAEMTVFSIPLGWPILLFTSLLLLPAATSGSLPADRKFGVAELLRSTPMSGGSYLVGKILGVGLTVALIGLIPLGLFFVVLEWAFLDAFQVWVPMDVVVFFLKFSILDALPILGWGLTIGILAGSVFRSRQAAVFPGLVAGIFSILFWLVAFCAPTMQMDLVAYYLLQNYHSNALDAMAKATGTPFPSLLGEGAPLIGIGRVIGMYLIIAFTLLSLAGIVRLWLKWKENF
jgi:ABC-type Na+ efflux pump permease subunit